MHRLARWHPELKSGRPCRFLSCIGQLAPRHIIVAQIAAHAAGGKIFALELGETIVEMRVSSGLDAVEPRGIHAEDRALDLAGGGAERREAVFVLYVLRNFQAVQAFDLPLRRAGPDRVGAPHHVIRTQSPDQHAHDRGGQPRLRHSRHREHLAEVAIDIVYAKVLRNLGEIGDPLDAPSRIELRQRFLGRTATGKTIGRVIDDTDTGTDSCACCRRWCNP